MSERAKKSGNEDAIPVIRLTIVNIHSSHVADAKYYLRREMQAAEAAGAKIVIKVHCIRWPFVTGEKQDTSANKVGYCFGSKR